MKKFSKFLKLSLLVIPLLVGLAGPSSALAATSPSLGTESTYGIVSSTYTNSLNAGTETTINGDVCYTTGPATAPIAINGATNSPCPAATGTAQSTALANLNSQACTSLGSNVVLSGTFTPGCYSSTGTMDITLSTTVTLNGPGTYIFRSGGALTTGANSKVVLTNGASASDVFWTPGGAVVIGANSSTSATPTFVGNIIADALGSTGINLGHFVNLLGRALAFGHTVTTDSNTITVPTTLNVIKTVINNNGGVAASSAFNLHVKLGGTDVAGSPAAGAATPGTLYTLSPNTYVVSEDANSSYTQSFSGDCNASGSVTLVRGDAKTCTITNDDVASPVPPSPAPASSTQPGTINVVKTVINNNGGTKVASDFPLFVSGTGVVSGQTNTFPVTGGIYTVTETNNSGYLQSFSGDCDLNGQLNLNHGDNKVCIVTNNDIGASAPVVPPLIDVVKVPSPLSLPNGPGPVTYTYTLRNVGTVPVTNVTMVGDTCSPITLASGDTNNNSQLDLNEVWTYTCSTNLSATHTNTVTATGWANGISAVDVASATVVVGAPIVPPLIHVTKVPSPLLLGAGGGWVTYTETVTNPGTVALSWVSLTDDKCAVSYVSGDVNGNGMLDTTETWTWTCQQNLTQDTTNTAVATGQANGLTARDFAIATVLVPVTTPTPTFPNTGFGPTEENNSWGFAMLAGVLALVSTSLVLALRKSKIKS